MTLPVRDFNAQSLDEFEEKMTLKGIPLGTKIINGHTCIGTRYAVTASSAEEVWTGSDINGTRVYSKVIDQRFGVMESHLISYVAKAPSPSVFLIPPDYQRPCA